MKVLIADVALGFGKIMTDFTLHKVVVWQSPLTNVKRRVKITRSRNGNGYHVDIGKPNYAERAFLKDCKIVGAKPKKIWYKHMPKKRG